MLTQYKSHSLDRHVTRTWRMSTMLGNYVAPIPAQQRIDKSWYQGSADAIFQSFNTITDEKPDIVVVVGADHVYRMDFSQMVEQHIESGAGVTVAAIRQPIAMSTEFGVIDVEPDDPSKIRAFLEKPADPDGLPDSPDEILASDGQLRLRRRRAHRCRARGRDARRLEARHGRRHRAGPGRARAPRTPTTSRTT